MIKVYGGIMLNSMTGYGRQNYVDENFNIDLEIKTVNSRYLDISIRMPSMLNFLEDKLRKTIKEKIARGRIELSIRMQAKGKAKGFIEADLELAQQTKNVLLDIANHIDIEANISLQDILKNEDVFIFNHAEVDQEALQAILLPLLDEVLEQVNLMRKKEGQALANILEDYIGVMEEKLEQLSLLSKDLALEMKDKLTQSISKLLNQVPINEDRLANEIVFYADRADIQEELIRLKSHNQQFLDSMANKKPVGKTLDFISQEMLREANTIGSKSNKEEITKLVIEMKTTIEKIKEQVQNIQ